MNKTAVFYEYLDSLILLVMMLEAIGHQSVNHFYFVVRMTLIRIKY